MRKILLIGAGVISLVAIAWVQVNNADPRAMASLIPAGPMIYLEAKDFHSLLGEWNQSGVKRTWLASANQKVLLNSNLLQKLAGLYQEYGNVAGFMPGVPGTLEIAGRESALALYDLRDQHFVYITRVAESQLTNSQLWRLREKFTRREASGIPFYHRRDDASNRSVAFAFTNGWLVLANRDDLIASTLGLIASQGSSGSLGNESWFGEAVAQAGNAGELRMALNIQTMVADVLFRSYWIQRNVAELRAFRAGIVDVQRNQNEIAEKRVFTRAAEQVFAMPAASALQSVAGLRALTPLDAALVRAWAQPSPELARSLIESKVLQFSAQSGVRSDYAPDAVSTDLTTGSEQDLETRVDEASLPSDVAGVLKSTALRELLTKASPDGMLHIQTSANSGRFVRTPSVMVLSTASGWDAVQVREALSSAVETLWTTARLGVGWQQVAINRHPSEQLNGLATLQFFIDGKLLFLSNDAVLLGATLDRLGAASLPIGPVYAAEFRHAREKADYQRMMQALDFVGAQQSFLFNPQGDRTPRFFSENVQSISSTFGFIQTMSVTESESPGVQRQTVSYK